MLIDWSTGSAERVGCLWLLFEKYPWYRRPCQSAIKSMHLFNWLENLWEFEWISRECEKNKPLDKPILNIQFDHFMWFLLFRFCGRVFEMQCTRWSRQCKWVDCSRHVPPLRPHSRASLSGVTEDQEWSCEWRERLTFYDFRNELVSFFMCDYLSRLIRNDSFSNEITWFQLI
jgi:hypothetical protein